MKSALYPLQTTYPTRLIDRYADGKLDRSRGLNIDSQTDIQQIDIVMCTQRWIKIAAPHHENIIRSRSSYCINSSQVRKKLFWVVQQRQIDRDIVATTTVILITKTNRDRQIETFVATTTVILITKTNSDKEREREREREA